jgi:hypothetical protein
MSTTTTPYLNPKETAKVIRGVLRKAFPATKFSVTTARGSMVSSVDIRWTDGPTVARVDALVAGFHAFVNVDGVAYRPGTRYVHTSRTISAQLANRCIAQAVAYWGGIENPPVAVEGPCGYNLEPRSASWENIRGDVNLDWSQAIHRAAADRTEFTREG